jgi:hypothetical protein
VRHCQSYLRIILLLLRCWLFILPHPNNPQIVFLVPTCCCPQALGNSGVKAQVFFRDADPAPHQIFPRSLLNHVFPPDISLTYTTCKEADEVEMFNPACCWARTDPDGICWRMFACRGWRPRASDVVTCQWSGLVIGDQVRGNAEALNSRGDWCLDGTHGKRSQTWWG